MKVLRIKSKAKHDVSGESRDSHGRWATGDGYTPKDISVMKAYQKEPDMEMVGDLRQAKGRLDLLADSIRKKVEVYDAILSKSTLGEQTTVYRIMEPDVYADLEVGYRYVDHGFMSTTHDLKAVARLLKEDYRKGQIKVKIDVPKGIHGFDMEHGLGDTQVKRFEWEKELLLPRGLAFTLLAKSKTEVHLVVVKTGVADDDIFAEEFTRGAKTATVSKFLVVKGQWDKCSESKAAHDTSGEERDTHGRWTVGGQVGAAFAKATLENRKEWIKANQTRYDSDPEVRSVADILSLYTQGDYDKIRAFCSHAVTGEWGAKYSDSTLPRWEKDKTTMFTSALSKCKFYFKGQEPNENGRLSASWFSAARNLNKAMQHAPTTDRSLFRGCQGGGDRKYTWFQELKALKVGDAFEINAPSSFTTDPVLAEDFAKGTVKGQLNPSSSRFYTVFEVLPGAKGLPVGALSPYKQEEVLASGKFEVAAITHRELPNVGRFGKEILRIQLKQVYPKKVKSSYEPLDWTEFFGIPFLEGEFGSNEVEGSKAKRDVSGEARDSEGRWTSIGGTPIASIQTFPMDHAEIASLLGDMTPEAYCAGLEHSFGSDPALKLGTGKLTAFITHPRGKGATKLHLSYKTDSVDFLCSLVWATKGAEPTLDLGYIELPQDTTGKGGITGPMGYLLKVAKKMKVNKMTLQAGLNVGGYAWARYGFLPTSQSWDELRVDVRQRLAKTVLVGKSDEEARKLIGEVKTYTAPRAPATGIRLLSSMLAPALPTHLADANGAVPLPLGKRLLLGTIWNGELDLNDTTSMAVFHNKLASTQPKAHTVPKKKSNGGAEVSHGPCSTASIAFLHSVGEDGISDDTYLHSLLQPEDSPLIDEAAIVLCMQNGMTRPAAIAFIQTGSVL